MEADTETGYLFPISHEDENYLATFGLDVDR